MVIGTTEYEKQFTWVYTLPGVYIILIFGAATICTFS